jgi:hypothetical protein
MKPTRAALLVLACALASSVAAAQSRRSVDACADAAERGQQLQKRGKLLDARASFRECAQATCPSVVRADCTRWERDVENAIPSVVLAVRSAGGEDVTDITVLVDGVSVAGYTSGLAVQLEPGEHVLRIERPNGDAMDRTIVVREGEKRRLVDLTFERRPIPPPPPPPPKPPPPSKTPTLVWILGGVGVAGLVGFGAVGLDGINRYQRLESECGKTRACSGSEISSNRTQIWIADALGFVGIAALGAAAVILITHRGEGAQSSQ